ncbi:MAG TPA: FtsK/SpoIIIE domain-containing protein [Nakamurella sp.]
MLLLGLGVMTYSVGWASAEARRRLESSPADYQQVRVALTAVTDWAPAASRVFLWSGAGALAIGVCWNLARRRRRQLRARVLTAASMATRVGASDLSLRRARWARRGRGLRSGVLRYRPADAVVADCSEVLTSGLEPHVAAPVVIRWDPRRSRFRIEARPYVQPRLEERYPQLGKLAETLAHVIGALVVDQRRSTVKADGSVQQLVARYAHTTRDIADTFRQRVQTVLDAKAPSPTGYWTARWDPAANEVTVVPAEPLPRWAPYPLELPAVGDQMRVPLGLGDGGQVVYWQPALFPHLMAVGPTGTGKTVFLFGVIISCLLRGWIIVLLDPKELSFRGFDPAALTGRGIAPWGGVVSVATTEAEMEDAIGYFHANMRNRYAAIKGFAVEEDDLPPVLMIVDEAGELVERLNEYQSSEEKYADLMARAEMEGRDPEDVAKPKGMKNPELRKVWSGLRLGRQAKDFVCTATQRPDVTFIPGEARSNLTTRVGLGHLDGAALEMVFNTRAVQQRVYDYVVDTVTGQRQRQRVRGRATVDVGGGPQTIQTYFVPDPAKLVTGELGPEEVAIVERLRDLVTTARRQWEHQVEAPPASARQLVAAARDLTAQEVQAPVATDAAESIEEPAGEPIAAERLEVGQSIVVGVDGAPLVGIVTEIEDDPFQPEDLQFTYRIGEGERAGEVWVTSFGRRELVPALPHVT